MSDIIDVLNERDDVAKTEFTQYEVDTSDQVTIELWHDTEGLQRVAERAMSGVALSQKGIKNLAEDEAIAKRETRVDTWADIAALYPETVDNFEEDDAN